MTFIPFEQCVQWTLQSATSFPCKGVNVPTSHVGEDLTFGYVAVFSSNEVSVVAKPFASGGFGDIFMAQVGARPAVVKELKAGNAQGFAEFQRETSLMVWWLFFFGSSF